MDCVSPMISLDKGHNFPLRGPSKVDIDLTLVHVAQQVKVPPLVGKSAGSKPLNFAGSWVQIISFISGWSADMMREEHRTVC